MGDTLLRLVATFPDPSSEIAGNFDNKSLQSPNHWVPISAHRIKKNVNYRHFGRGNTTLKRVPCQVGEIHLRSAKQRG